MLKKYIYYLSPFELVTFFLEIIQNHWVLSTNFEKHIIEWRESKFNKQKCQTFFEREMNYNECKIVGIQEYFQSFDLQSLALWECILNNHYATRRTEYGYLEDYYYVVGWYLAAYYIISFYVAVWKLVLIVFINDKSRDVSCIFLQCILNACIWHYACLILNILCD